MNGKYAVQINNICQVVSLKGKRKKILSDLSLSVRHGEFIAIVGCSGAGKTTLMNILSGYTKCSSGNVYIDGLDLYEEENYFKGKIAYVPQQEILDPTLTLQKSLEYSLLLRVKKVSKKQMMDTIDYILETLELSHVRNTLIKNLSGGEKKRASIATEMLSDPNLFLLDEPTSGLDANIEKKIMKKLREIANMGKTIIITAHTVSNLHLCDKILFMGKEGKICYYGPYNEIFNYFKVKEFVDIYDLLKEDTDSWYLRYRKNENPISIDKSHRKEKRKQAGFVSQVKTLVKRYISSLINNKFMLILLLGQAVMMGFLICLATEKNCLQNPVTASMIFVAFTLAAVWLGLFNTIQEIVKEKDMLKKEYMSGLRFTSYMTSKIIIFSILCFYQSITCVSIVYFHLNPRPDTVLVMNTLVDLIINFFLVSFSTSIIGIFISSFVKDTKTTLILSPLYMMIQMLFSGMFIPFIEFTKNVSYFVIARWGYENFGTISNLSQYGVVEPSKDFFLFQSYRVLGIWLIFVIILVLFLIASIITIKLNILKQDHHYLKVHNKKIGEQ
ncbi:MAG: ABC transporter ATP-binding protein/permease [Bacilli bacterium]|nr:ABC transporter ATP-binding protein/permease [Bacilli bacterium]